MAIWDEIGSFLNNVVNTSTKALQSTPTPSGSDPSWAQLAGEAELQRHGLLSPFLGAALAGPGLRREAAQQRAALPKEASAIASLSGGRLTPEQVTSLITASPRSADSLIASLLRPQPQAKARRVFDAKRGGIINLDTGQFESIPGLPTVAASPRSVTLANEYMRQNPNATPDQLGSFLAKYRPVPAALPPAIVPMTLPGEVPAIASVPRSRGGGIGTPTLTPLGPSGATLGRAPSTRSSTMTPAQRAQRLATFRTRYNKERETSSGPMGTLSARMGLTTPVPSFDKWMIQNYPEQVVSLGVVRASGTSKATGAPVYLLNDGTWWSP